MIICCPFFGSDPEDIVKMDEDTVKKIQEVRSIYQLKKHESDKKDFVCRKSKHFHLRNENANTVSQNVSHKFLHFF